MSRYVELDKQSSFTGDKNAIKWLPESMRAAAEAEVDATAPTNNEVVLPSQMGPGSAKQRADLLARAKSAKTETESGLMAKLRQAFTQGIQEQGEPVREFPGYGDAQSELLKVGLNALNAGATAAAAQLDPAAAAAAKAKAEEEARMAKLKMVGGVAVLLGLGYFFFMRKKTTAARKKRKSRRKKK